MPRPRVLVVIGLVAALAVGAWTVLAPSALPRLVDDKKAASALEQELARQQSDNAQLEAQIQALKQPGAAGQEATEKAARRELGFVRPDEVVFTGLPVEAPTTPGAR